ncbi:MAG: SIMPL domain-containing protein [Candidatus Microgenomates bacterium]|jgi:uncharacterized protein YggE
MNKAIPAIAFFFVALFIYSKFGPNLPISLLTQQKGEPLVVSEQGKASGAPDMATISAGIEDNGASLTMVENSVNLKAKTLAEAVKKMGVNSEDIQTSDYNVYPNYDYNITPNKITGYRVSTTYQIKIRDLSKINDIVGALAPAGANQVGDITFTFGDATQAKLMDQARKEAVDKAKQKAESLAKAAGITLGKIINISESNENNVIPQPLYATGSVSDKTITPPTIQTGTSEVATTVTISWEIR